MRGSSAGMGQRMQTALGFERSQHVDDGNQVAVTTHHALQWQQEAERLNRLVHQLRRELEAAKNTSGRTVIQSLLTTLEHCEPFVRASRNNFTGQRVTGMLDELVQVRHVAEAALEHIR